MYADQINLTTLTELVTVQVMPQPGTDLIVEPQEPSSGQFTVTFTGRRSDLEDFRQDLVSGKFKPVYYVKKDEAKGETLTKDGVEMMNLLLHQETGSSGARKSYPAITVQEIKPDQMKIFIDRHVTVKMPVVVNTGLTKTTAPVVTPASVDVTIPASVLQGLYPTEKIIRLDMENVLRGRIEDREFDEEVPVTGLVMGQKVETQPAKVRVKLRIVKQFKTRPFELSQIQILGPSSLLAKYRVEIRDPRVTVTLKGPAELIDALKPQSIVGYVKLYPEDMSRPWTTVFPRPVQLEPIEGERIKLDPDSPPPTVDIKLVELHEAAPAGQR